MTLEDDLLAAIAADVDADLPRLVYADWLSTTGDPRGEHIILQHRLEAGHADQLSPDAAVRARELLDQQVAALCGTDMQHEVIARIRLGFVERLKLTRRAVAEIREHPAWLEAPALRFVRELDVAIIDRRVWELVAAWRHRAHVRRVEHGSVDKAMSPANLTSIAELFPALRSLKLRTPSYQPLAALAALPLDTFEIEARRLEDRVIVELLAMPWRLHTLSVRSYPGALAAIEPLLDGRVFPEVRDLEVLGFPIAAVVERLVASGRIATIETLRMDFTLAADELVRFRDALAPVRLELPIHPSGPPTGAFAILLARLGKHAEALPRFARSEAHGTAAADWLRGYAIAVRHTGGRDLARALVWRVLDERGGDSMFDELLLVVDELLAGGDRDPALVVHRARSLAVLGRGAEALAAIAEVPDGPAAHLVRALAYDQLGDVEAARAALAALATCGVAWRAQALLIGGRFDEVVARSCTRPAEIAAALGPGASRAEAFDVAEIAIVAAACAGDRRLVRTRMAGLVGTELHDRRWNPDLIAACRHRERALAPDVRELVRKVHAGVQGHAARMFSHVVQFDQIARTDDWLNQPAMQ